MAGRVPAGLTRAEGRRFGVTVGLAFLALAALFWWRGHGLPMRITGALGSVLVLAGLTVPGHLGPVYRAWMRLALVISRVTTPIFMGIVYFLVITPSGLVLRLLGRNPIRHDGADTYWHARSDDAPGSMQRQF